jgi:serine/threonine protein kinase
MAWAAADTVPHTVGDYEVLEKIADGSLSAVHKARHRETGAVVAVKLFSPEVMGDEVLLGRIEQEFRAASTVRHPHLVRALDHGRDGPVPYLVMEYVDGGDLGQRLQQSGPLPEAEAVRLILQVAQALHKAHTHGIIHRDVKPANILLTSDGRARLADLGLAKDLEADAGLTRPGKGLGTPNFMAPEQFSDAKNADVRCDVYSLGATLYTAVTGELPFRARGITGILKKKDNNELVPPRQLVPALSERLDWVVRRAMRADPRERHPSCLEFSRALTGDGGGPGSSPSRADAAVRGPTNRPGPSGENRRVSVRYPCSLETHCDLQISVHPEETELQDRWEATVRDLSVSGIGLLLPRRFEPGTNLTVDLRADAGGAGRSLEMRVARARRVAPGQWLLGCTFATPLGKDELRKLL